MNTLPVTYQFEGASIRLLQRDGQPWFIAADVADALEYRMASDMVRFLDDDERGTHIVRTPSGDQEMLVISESGLYSAVLRSRKPEAKRFRKWVTSEVLPSIRATGGYAKPAEPAPTYAHLDAATRRAVNLCAHEQTQRLFHRYQAALGTVAARLGLDAAAVLRLDVDALLRSGIVPDLAPAPPRAAPEPVPTTAPLFADAPPPPPPRHKRIDRTAAERQRRFRAKRRAALRGFPP